MALSRTELEQIAKLARLQLVEDDIEELSDKLSGIIDFFTQLNAIDTSDVMPMAHPLEMVQRLRDDEVTERDERDKFQAQAAEVEDGLYLVPKVIE